MSPLPIGPCSAVAESVTAGSRSRLPGAWTPVVLVEPLGLLPLRLGNATFLDVLPLAPISGICGAHAKRSSIFHVVTDGAEVVSGPRRGPVR